jgi:hypothetical protein
MLAQIDALILQIRKSSYTFDFGDFFSTLNYTKHWAGPLKTLKYDRKYRNINIVKYIYLKHNTHLYISLYCMRGQVIQLTT